MFSIYMWVSADEQYIKHMWAWPSAVKLVSCRRFIKDLLLIRSCSVSGLACLNPTWSNLEEETSHTNYKTNVSDAICELDAVKVVEVLNNLRNEPLDALSFFCQLEKNGFSHNISTYAAMFRILCYARLQKKLESILLKVIRKENDYPGFKIMDLFKVVVQNESRDLVCRMSDAFMKAYASVAMFDEALEILVLTKQYGFAPNIFSCNFLMNRLVECRKLDMAVAIYEDLKRLGLSPNDYSYVIAIKALCKMGDMEAALHVFQAIEKAGVTPRVFAYSTYIEGLCAHRRSDEASGLLKKLVISKVPIDGYAFTVVIRGLCNEMKLKEAESVLLDMQKQGFTPTMYDYGALICGYSKVGHLPRAMALHDKTIAKGIKTNCVIVSPILQGLCQKGMAFEAFEKFKEFEKSGIFLDEACYNVFLDALFKTGKVEYAVELFSKMKAKKIAPDAINYTTLISRCCIQGRMFDASNLFREMMDNGHKPDIVTYNVLAGGFSRKGLMAETSNLLNYMEAQGLKPNTTTHSMIIEGLCIGGKVEEAEAFFARLEKKHFENYAANAMVNGYCEANHTREAFELFITLSKQGRIGSKASCYKLLRNLCVEGEDDKSLLLLETMLSLDVNPNQTLCSSIIGTFCRARYMEKAQSLFNMLVGRGLIPDVITYTMMINSYCRMNRLREANDLFSDMKKRGIRPDVITYTVLLGSCFEINRSWSHSVPHAVKTKVNRMRLSALENEMKDMDVRPDVICYTVLIDGNCKTNNLEDATNLFEEMIGRGLEPDTKTFTALISGYLRNGDREGAVLRVNEMEMKGIEADDWTVSVLLDGGILKARKVQFQH